MTRYKSKRSNATDFNIEVKNQMLVRDRHSCIFCKTNNNLTPAHYIGRGRGGLGIIQNGACVCVDCHMRMDQSNAGVYMKKLFRKYLDRYYPGFEDSNRIYKKGVGF